MRANIVICLILAAALACNVSEESSSATAEGNIGESKQQVICGTTDDSVPTSTYNGSLGPTKATVDRLKSSEGQLIYAGYGGGIADCSGTLIAHDLFITANHCVPSSRGMPYAVELYDRADGTYGSTFYNIAEVVEEGRNLGLGDYAILRLDGNPGATYRVADIGFALRPAGSMATVIGFPFGTKKVSVGTLQADPNNPGLYNYDADTEAGSSGSGVFDDLGFLIGVHFGGTPGCPTGGFNTAVRLFDLATSSPALKALLDIPVPSDYDNDYKADFAVRSANGTWRIDFASNGRGSWDLNLEGYGSYADRAIPADYDGDNKADLAIFTPGGTWYIDYSANGFGTWDHAVTGHGSGSDRPVPADYDRDGKADLSVHTTDGRWLIDFASNGFGGWDVAYLGYGSASSDYAVPADYDGDHMLDLSIVTAAGDWYIDYAVDGLGVWNVSYHSYGLPPIDVPVPADYDGDQKADLAVRAAGGGWLIDYASNGFGTYDATLSGWNTAQDRPVPADYDRALLSRSNKDDIAVFSSTNVWRVDLASNGFLGADIVTTM